MMKIYKPREAQMKRNYFIKMIISLLIFILLPLTTYADSVISNRTGTIKITKPDGITLIIQQNEQLPHIPPGSIIEVISGSISVEPMEGSISVIVNNSIATIEAGSRATVFIPRDNDLMGVSVIKGKVNIVAANTTVIVREGQEALVGYDLKTQTAKIQSTKGQIEAITAGVKVLIPENVTANIFADPATRNIKISSSGGNIQVTQSDGEIITLADGEVIETPASEESEIITVVKVSPEVEEPEPIVVSEEPSEPERPEGSVFRP
jgi:hypothetical protein